LTDSPGAGNAGGAGIWWESVNEGLDCVTIAALVMVGGFQERDSREVSQPLEPDIYLRGNEKIDVRMLIYPSGEGRDVLSSLGGEGGSRAG